MTHTMGECVTAYLSQHTICPWYVYTHRAIWHCVYNTVPLGVHALPTYLLLSKSGV